ncbi:hypothetical protein AB0L65_31775 [Nonomuraea sp. NPDC052116]|uniref:hypothetical protein n=1 Tax=Nonomuraea sp. NPDC052116 TaxID=3155665 RepID=UPI003416825B
MQDAAEPVSSADGQARDSLGVSDRIRDGTQRGGWGESLMGSVPVVELFVLAQGVPQVAFVPQQAAVEKLGDLVRRAGLSMSLSRDHPSAATAARRKRS